MTKDDKTELPGRRKKTKSRAFKEVVEGGDERCDGRDRLRQRQIMADT